MKHIIALGIALGLVVIAWQAGGEDRILDHLDFLAAKIREGKADHTDHLVR